MGDFDEDFVGADGFADFGFFDDTAFGASESGEFDHFDGLGNLVSFVDWKGSSLQEWEQVNADGWTMKEMRRHDGVGTTIYT